MPESFCIMFSGILWDNAFPNIIAIKSLMTIPAIAPHIRETLYREYSIPSPIDKYMWTMISL